MNCDPLMPHENILGCPVTSRNTALCVEQIFSWIESGEKNKYFVCANPHSLEIAGKDSVYKRALLAADLMTPDGVGIVMASKILGGNIKDRVTGSDIFRELNAALDRRGGFRCFFLGSTRENLALVCDRMAKEFPRIEIAGTYSPPFKAEFSPEENRIMVEMVNRVASDVLWVGMTAPKQEKWIYLNKDKLNVKFIAAVGAVFDFYAGNVKRSHPWFLEHGLEWLPRLLQEPRRLWQRTFISAPLFLLRVFRQKITGKV